MEIQIKMISSASKALDYIRDNPHAIDEEIFQYLTEYMIEEKIKEDKIHRAMLASASKVIDISRKNPHLPEKEILRKLINDIPFLTEEIFNDNN